MLKKMLCGLAFAAVAVNACAQENFSPEQIKRGSSIFSQNCAPCHGPRMADPQGAFDLRTFPHDDRARFFNSVTKGKGKMPPWGDILKPDEIAMLWAYVRSGG